MKRIVLLLLLLSALAYSQNVAVWTHQAANTDAFKKGCPGNWPYVTKDLGSEKLPDDLQARGWKLMTKDELIAAKTALEAAKEQWNTEQEVEITAPKRDRDALIKQAKAELAIITDTQGSLTLAQLSNAVRSLARIQKAIIVDLGY